MKNKKGFTLIELLAVIVVLAIILVIAVPQIMSTIEESRIATFESTVKLIKTTAEKRFLENETLGITDEIKCEDIVSLSSEDYEWCEVSIDNGKSSVTLVGKGKFENLKEYGTISGYVENLFKADEKREENSLTNLDPDKNIRYSGSNPNNYVYYNCSDKDNNGITYGINNYDYKNSCELWRIIGVFDVSNGEITEKRVKLVRNESLLSASWDSSAETINAGYGVNEWSQADIKEMLNTYYIGESDECNFCDGQNQETCENSCNSTVKKLSDTSFDMIEDVVWYTGAKEYAETMPLIDMYSAERGTQTGNGLCNAGTTECNDTVKRTTEWNGLVGLIYVSDYAYASIDESCLNDIVGEDSTCENKNWLNLSYEHKTINPSSSKANRCWYVTKRISVGNAYSSVKEDIHPSVYLKSSVNIIGGDGTNTEGNGTGPYRLSL